MGHLDAGATPNGPRQHQDVSEARRGSSWASASLSAHVQSPLAVTPRALQWRWGGGGVAAGDSCPKSQPDQRAQESERARPVHVAGVSHEGPCAFSERFELPLSCEWDP